MKKDTTPSEKRSNVPFTAELWQALNEEWIAREDPETRVRPHKIQIVREWQRDATLYRGMKNLGNEALNSADLPLTQTPGNDIIFTSDERKYVDLLLYILREKAANVADMIRHVLEVNGAGGVDGNKGKRAESSRVESISRSDRDREGARGNRANTRRGKR